jgi:S1-C subfamily serine protease
VIADREDGAGVRLREVIADGPAAKAGLQAGDLITAINGQAVRQNSDMGKILENSPVGAELRFTVNRQNVEEEIPVVLTRRPTDARLPFGRLPDDAPSADTQPSLPANAVVPGPTQTGPVLGVRAVPVSIEAQRQFNLPDTKGAVVMGVTVGSAAERAGIPVGSIITSIDSQPVTDPDELGRLIREAGTGKEIEVVFLHRGQEFHRRTTLGGVAALPSRRAQDLTPVRQGEPTIGSRLSPNAFGSAGSSTDRVQALEQRVRDLEARLARLEAALRQEPEATGSE